MYRWESRLRREGDVYIVDLCRRLVLFVFGHYTVTLVARRPPPTRRPETHSRAIKPSPPSSPGTSSTPSYKCPSPWIPSTCSSKHRRTPGPISVLTNQWRRRWHNQQQPNIRRLDNTAGTVRATTLRPSAFSLVSSSLSTHLYQYLIFDCITLLD